MLDINYLVENTETLKKNFTLRNKNYDKQIDEIKSLYLEYKEELLTEENLKAKINEKSKKIGELKRCGNSVEEILGEVEEMKTKMKQINSANLYKKYTEKLAYLPNVLLEDTPIGKDDTENVEIKSWGEKRTFNFPIKEHFEIGTDNDTLDFIRGAKIAKSRFVVTKGLVAKLERALMNFMLDEHSKKEYLEVGLPYLGNEESFYCAGKLPKFQDDLFKIENSDNSDDDEFDNSRNFYLNPTAEVILANLHRDEILEESKLPIKYTAFSQAFRKEAGSAGRDTKGLIRLHQFGKVELFMFSKQEDSANDLAKMILDVENILEKLKLPYRIVRLCTGDMGDSSSVTYDFEAWFPGQNRYREVSSCSNVLDYQSRRLKTRYKTADNKKKYVHTLNGSGLATGRIVAAILENYQLENGELEIPDVLKDYIR